MKNCISVKKKFENFVKKCHKKVKSFKDKNIREYWIKIKEQLNPTKKVKHQKMCYI